MKLETQHSLHQLYITCIYMVCAILKEKEKKEGGKGRVRNIQKTIGEANSRQTNSDTYLLDRGIMNFISFRPVENAVLLDNY